MTDRHTERREQSARRQAVRLGYKLTKSGDEYVLLSESDAPLASGSLGEIEAKLHAVETPAGPQGSV